MTSSALARYLVHEVELKQQLEREQLPAGIAGFDEALGGLPRGAVTEVWGPATSGKTTFLTHFLAHATASGEFCALWMAMTASIQPPPLGLERISRACSGSAAGARSNR